MYHTLETVFHRDVPTPSIELKIRRAADYFWPNSRCSLRIADETLSRVFDISSQSKKELRRILRSKIVNIYDQVFSASKMHSIPRNLSPKKPASAAAILKQMLSGQVGLGRWAWRHLDQRDFVLTSVFVCSRSWLILFLSQNVFLILRIAKAKTKK